MGRAVETHMTLEQTEQHLRRLIYKKLVQKYEHIRIIVSIDAATEDTYNYLRRSNTSDTYIKLQRNMKILSKMRAENKIDFCRLICAYK